jgi:PBP1b-binding outer membrane lipoprotein LpoB
MPVVLLSTSVAFISSGCGPTGDTGGRISVSETTPAEAHSNQNSLATLTQFSDTAAMQIAEEIDGLPGSNPANKEKWVICLGDIENKTTSTPTSDFELFQKRLRSQLVNSKRIRENYTIVESRQRMEALLKRNQPQGTPDLLQEGDRSAQVNTYDPNHTYVLNGSFLEADRGNTAQWLMEFQLVNLQSGEIVISHSVDSAWIRK